MTHGDRHVETIGFADSSKMPSPLAHRISDLQCINRGVLACERHDAGRRIPKNIQLWNGTRDGVRDLPCRKDNGATGLEITPTSGPQ